MMQIKESPGSWSAKHASVRLFCFFGVSYYTFQEHVAFTSPKHYPLSCLLCVSMNAFLSQGTDVLNILRSHGRDRDCEEFVTRFEEVCN